MSEIMDDISYLSQEIGPRPAGTEEEQQAALYIADQFQKRTGFAATIEDFSAAVQPGIVEAICFGIPALVSLLAIIFNVFVVPAFIISLICVILYIFEIIDRPVLSRAFERGVSQNVVARYKPGVKAGQRNRKLVLVANYDSSKVQSELNGSLFSIYPALVKGSAIGLVALPIIWLIRTLFLLHATGGVVIFFSILAAIALVLALVPVAVFFMHKASTYNEAANNNATGVAALLEVARLISEGSYSEEELAAQEASHIHSAEEAYQAGVVPEGASLEYATVQSEEPSGGLAAAKAAVAAITGQPIKDYQVEHIDFTPLAERDDIYSYEEMDYGEYGYPEDEAEQEAEAGQEQADYSEQPAQPHEEALPTQAGETTGFTANPVTEREVESVPAPSPVQAEEQEPASETSPAFETYPAPTNSYAFAGQNNEPSWFTAGRAKAAKPDPASMSPVRRSRYADALDAAVAASQEHIDKAVQMLDEGTIERISEMQRNIEAGRGAALAENTASLQDIFSAQPEGKKAETTTQEPSQPVEDATPAPEDGHTQAVPATPSGQGELDLSEATSSQNSPEASTVPAETETPQAGAAPLVSVIQDFAPETSTPEGSDGATTAMPPINVDDLRQQASAETPASEPSASQSAAAPEAEYDFSQINAPARRKYRDIILPSFDNTSESNEGPLRHSNPLVSERLPRISVEESSEVETVVPEQAASSEAKAAPSLEERDRATQEKRAALRNVIPSLSGEFSPIKVTEVSDEDNAEVSKAGSFATGGADVAFEPVGDSLVADLAPEERYVEDADDASIEENTTETGAYTGPDYVDMPQSRLSRFFSRFRKKAEETEEETSASEWLDVEEDFNPTEVGAARGGWDSFRKDKETPDSAAEEDVIEATDEAPAEDRGPATQPEKRSVAAYNEDDEDEYAEDFDEYEYVDVDEEDARSWNGGAFSQLRAKLLSNEETEEAAEGLIESALGEEAEAAAASEDASQTAGEESEEQIAAARDAEKAEIITRERAGSSEAAQAESDRIAEEAKMIYSFRNPDINTEVWFVALGSEYAGNGGMKAFLAEHADELRGAIIVNLEALGAGDLCFIEEEGFLTTKKPSARLRRFLHKATEATGVITSLARISWRESAASLAMKRGLQAMTLAGMDGGKPAFLGQGDDVLENVSEEQVSTNAQFVLEFIKNI